MLIMSETVYSVACWKTLKIKHEFKSQSATSWMGINSLNLRTGGYNTHLKGVESPCQAHGRCHGVSGRQDGHRQPGPHGARSGRR